MDDYSLRHIFYPGRGTKTIATARKSVLELGLSQSLVAKCCKMMKI